MIEQFDGHSISEITDMPDFWEIYVDDTTLFYASNKTYHHDNDPDVKFDYKYVVQGYQLSEVLPQCDEEEEDIWVIELQLVPTPESMCVEAMDKVWNSCYVDKDIVPDIYDIGSYGYCVMMATDDIHEDDIEETLNYIANIIPMIDTIRGFYIDQVWNGMGADGWDILHEAVSGINWMSTAFQRAKDQSEAST